MSCEPDLRVQRQIEHGRAAAGDEKEDQRVLLRLFQHGQRRARRGKRVLIGQRVAALKIANPPVALFGQVIRATDAAQSLAPLHAVQQDFKHGPGGLAQRDDKDALVAARD